MIWFKHPNDLPNDKRLAALIDNEGCRGYGMYLRIIEMLCAQPDRKLSFNQLNIISRKGFSRKYMEKIIWEYQLFTIHEEEFESAIDFNHTEKGNHLQNDLKTPEKNEEAKNAHNQLKNRKDSKKTESKNQLFREMVCMRSGYSVLLNKHFDTALEEFKKHIVLLGKEERMNSQEEVRSYFTFYTQAGQRTSQELHMLLQGLEKQQSAAAPPDPYRYEQLVDGRRTYLGCPIPDGAPPRPDNTAFWNETARSWTSQTPPPSSKKPKQKPG